MRKKETGRRVHHPARTRVTFGAVLVIALGSTDVRLLGAGSADAAEPLVHPWQLIDGRHWQIVSPADRFEYPNRRGAYPWILVSWDEARGICASESKRLCTEAEWTFACEGEEALPYPYGYARDADACVIDRPWRLVHAEALQSPNTERAMAELDRLWRGEPSGARPRCRSPFGVYDMTGNVDEWTTSVVPGERPSILKGGYWGPVRTRCRPSTRAHGQTFAFYQQGLRCCSDAPVCDSSGGIAHQMTVTSRAEHRVLTPRSARRWRRREGAL